MNRKRFKKKSSVLFPVLIIGFLIVVVLFLKFGSNFFKVNHLEINNQNANCVDDQDLKSKIQIEGKSFLTLNSDGIVADIKNKYICIKQVDVARKFPGKVELKLVPRTAFVNIINLQTIESTQSALLVENIATPSSKESENAFLLDDEGVLFEKNKLSEVPDLFVYNLDLNLGQHIEKSKDIDIILEKLKVFNLNFKTFLLYNNSLIAYGLPKILFNLDGDIKTQIGSLQLILEKAKIDSESLEFIDLRFDKPIMRVAPKKK